MTFDIDTIETAAQSVTATVCENAALFGATPERNEFDSRDVWDRDDATDAVSEAFRILAEGVAPDGFQLADERESLLWGFVNMLDAFVYESAQGCARMDITCHFTPLYRCSRPRRHATCSLVCAPVSFQVLNSGLNIPHAALQSLPWNRTPKSASQRSRPP